MKPKWRLELCFTKSRFSAYLHKKLASFDIFRDPDIFRQVTNTVQILKTQ